MDRLDAAAIVVPGVQVRVVERCTSTNSVLLSGPYTGPVLLAAEEQTAGRGRRGRRWHSAPGAGITFSLSRSLHREAGALDQFVEKIDRNEIIARIARSLLDALDEFEAKGLDSARRDWEAMDAHAGQRLRVRLADGRVLTGVASGLDADGGLRLATRGGLRAVCSGRVVSLGVREGRRRLRRPA